MATQWVWQKFDWPNFIYEPNLLQQQERQFLRNAGFLLGAYQHTPEENKEQLKIDLVSEEAIKTSAIEGELLDRASVQASLRRNFGLNTEARRLPPSEQGIAYMMVDLYKNFAHPLTHEILYDWNQHLIGHRADVVWSGFYRVIDEPMEIISGPIGRHKVHYQAPPASRMSFEMTQYIKWYNSSLNLPILTRAGIAHLYFELVHPFEDGNGRIGRALVEKSIAQSLSAPLLLAFSRIIQKNKKEYYAALEAQNNNLEINAWLTYFADIMLSAQEYTAQYIEFLSAKTRLYDRAKELLNSRQSKVIGRMFQEGLEGFKGGLSAENYITITQTSRATATRDLQDLVDKKILYKTGELKGTRYFLLLD